MATHGKSFWGTRNPLPPRLGLRFSLGIFAGALALLLLLPGCLFFAALGPFQAATPRAFALFLTALAPFVAVIAAAGLLAPPCTLLEKVVGRRYVGSTSLTIA